MKSPDAKTALFRPLTWNPFKKSVTIVVSWQASTSATSVAQRQLQVLMTDTQWVATMARRFANVGSAQREGHIFEWLHELSFNLAAVAENDSFRLMMTERLGDPHSPADMRLVDKG